MKIEIKKISYYIFIFFIMVYYGFRRTMVDYSVFNICMYLAIPFLAIKLFLEKYTLKEAFIILGLVILGAIESFKMGGDTSILIAICVVVGMKDIDYKIPLKIVFWVRLVVTVVVFLMSGLGWIENTVIIREGLNNVIRNSMGYAHPNTLGVYCFILISLWILLYQSKNFKYKILACTIFTLIIYTQTNSRTSVVLIMFYLVLCIFSEKVSLDKLKKFGIFAIAGVAAFNVLVSFIYNGQGLLFKLNIILNSRISLGASYLRVYGVHLFGQPIQSLMNESTYWYLDSGWMNLLLNFGIITFVLYLVLSLVLCKRTDDKHLIVTLITFSIYGMMENILSSMLFNYMWIIFGKMLFEKKKSIAITEVEGEQVIPRKRKKIRFKFGVR